MTPKPPRKPLGLSPAVQALLAEERVPPAQAALVRARLLARAREALANARAETPPLNAVASRSPRMLIAAALIALAGIAAAFQLATRASGSLPAPSSSVRPAHAIHTDSVTPAQTFVPETPAVSSSAIGVPAPSASFTSANASSRAPGVPRRAEALEEELPLLNRARSAAGEADYAAVLRALNEHERRFPRGRLSEEREVLRVKALVGLGRVDEAGRAATRFQRRFPKSVLLEKVDEMLP